MEDLLVKKTHGREIRTETFSDYLPRMTIEVSVKLRKMDSSIGQTGNPPRLSNLLQIEDLNCYSPVSN